MKFQLTGKKYSGVLVPVYSLNSKKSEGCGDFLDLIPFAEFCQKSGIEIIQLLPINDTGGDSSPYSAVSSMALQIVNIRISAIQEFLELPENHALIKSVQELTKLKDVFRYNVIRDKKISILKELFQIAKESIFSSGDFKKWLNANQWSTNYGVFMKLKDLHAQKSWRDWDKEFLTSTKTIKKFKDDEETIFYAWVQFRLEAQLLLAVKELASLGILLKGDIPILMNEDSVDVWHEGENFHLDKKAGAPPDMFSKIGQNWGFPIYNWDYLRDNNYAWWKARLKQASKFYSIFRIDHVLGFFRIWTLGAEQRDGVLGYFNPSIYATRNDLQNIGFDLGRIRWLSEPHITGQKMQELFGADANAVKKSLFVQVNNEDLYLFRKEVNGEHYILNCKGLDAHKHILLELYRDRALLEVQPDMFSFTWFFRNCWRYDILAPEEKSRFESLVASRAVESEKIWEIHGRELLSFIRDETDMLACAEDLGVIPDCVPRVLNELGILSLKIPRWARAWNENGQPYIKHTNYPYGSVCAISVHDTSTSGDWWDNEANRLEFLHAFDLGEEFNKPFSPEVAEALLGIFFKSNSAICLTQIQDFFALDADYIAKDARTERMNIPGTTGNHNWSWRISTKIESLIKDTKFIQKVLSITNLRK